MSTTKFAADSTHAPAITARDRAAIIETVQNVAHGADLRQWDVVRASFAEVVVLDYGAPELTTPEQIVETWRPLLSAFDSTQHVIREPFIGVIEEGRVRVTSSFQATHHLKDASGGDLWMFVGRYEHELVQTAAGWKIARMRMLPERSTGNDRLLDIARARAGVVAPARAFSVERITFQNEGSELVGWLYRPSSATGSLPAVVVTGAWTTVKEQMPQRYAEKLAEKGLVALVFDFRGWGESGGTPRQWESPARKTADIVAAVAFLTRARGVDGGRLGLLAICASSGYAIAAAAQSRLVKSVALVAPWLHDVPIAKEVYGSSYGPKAESGRAAGESFSSTGSIRHIPAASSSDAAAAMFGPADVLDYYLSPMRGAIPQWQNAFAEMSWEDWLNYDSHSVAQALDVPLQLVHSETAAIPHGARRFLELVDSPKSELWLEKRTQFDFYDDPKTVSEATEAVRAHFERTLATPRESTVSQQQP